MPLHSCTLLPCCTPLKHSSTLGRHALHGRQSCSRRHSRRRHGPCIEAKKKGQIKASKRFGHQTIDLKTPNPGDGDSSSHLTDYLKLGRAIGESPVEVEKNLKARGVAVNWDNDALNYMQKWQDEDMHEYAAAAAVMTNFAQKASIQSKSKLNARLQKQKGQGGMESSVFEFAQEQMAAHDTGAKRFKPLMVLKAKKGKTASGVALARKPGRGGASGSVSERGNGETLVLSRPRPPSEDEAHWLQQAVEGGVDDDDDDDGGADFTSNGSDAAASLYGDFEAILSRSPKTRLNAKQKPQSKPPLTPPRKRLQGSTLQSQRAQASSSSPAMASSSSFVEEEAAPMVAVRPGIYWQTKPSPPKVVPPAPQKPPPLLLGRPAKPPPPVEEKLKEEQQQTAAKASLQKPPPTLGRRPAKPLSPVEEELRGEEQQAAAESPLHKPPPTLGGRPAKPRSPMEEELTDKEQRMAAEAPLEKPPLTLGGRPAKPTPLPAQVDAQQSLPKGKNTVEKLQPPAVSVPPPVPQPTLLGRPAKPPSTHAQVAEKQQMSREEEVNQERQLSAPSTQQRPQHAQRAVQTGAAPKQLAQPVFERPSRPETSKPEASVSRPPKLSRPLPYKAGEEDQQQQQLPSVSRPMPLPALSRPAPLRAAIVEEEAAIFEKLEKLATARKLRQFKLSAGEVPAKWAAADKAPVPAAQSLPLISPPRRREKPSIANPKKSGSWGVEDLGKWAAKSPDLTAHKPHEYFQKAALQQGVQGQEAPPPPLAGPPARRPPGNQGSLTVVEWRDEVVFDYAQRAMEAQRQLTVIVTGANTGGLMVRNGNLRGFIPTNMLSQTSYSQVMARQAEIKQEQDVPDDAPEEQTRKIRSEALKCLLRSILTVTIVDVVPSGRRFILSERPPTDLSDNPSQQQLDPQCLAVLQQNLGEVVEGVIVDVRPFGCFMEFDVEAEGGDKHKVYGMVHVSEMSWEYNEDARLLAKTGQGVEAVLMGVDPSTGRVWLSMRQVLADPLQETLDALLAQGPPSDLSEDGDEDEDGDDMGQSAVPEDLSYPQEEASMAFQEAVEVAEALVLLPGVDSVTPGRQVFTRAAARDLQVYLSNMPLADLAAAISEEEQGSSSSDEDEQDFTDDEEAAIASAVSTSEDDSVRGEVQNHPVLQSSVAAADEQPASAAAMEQLTSDEDQLIPLGVVEASYAADASALGMAQDDDVSEASTLVVRKGQQLQELLVSGSITQEQLRHEVEKIVSFLLSPEDVQ